MVFCLDYMPTYISSLAKPHPLLGDIKVSTIIKFIVSQHHKQDAGGRVIIITNYDY